MPETLRCFRAPISHDSVEAQGLWPSFGPAWHSISTCLPTRPRPVTASLEETHPLNYRQSRRSSRDHDPPSSHPLWQYLPIVTLALSPPPMGVSALEYRALSSVRADRIAPRAGAAFPGSISWSEQREHQVSCPTHLREHPVRLLRTSPRDLSVAHGRQTDLSGDSCGS